MIEPIEGTEFSQYKEKILKAIERNNGYCPCVREKEEDTLCPCKYYRDTLHCHCSLFINK
jgi:ferredoxin-thioredoxin reductase catalytic subunit